MLNLLIIIFFIAMMLVFHESSHIISARMMGLKLYQIGFKFKPLPHFSVKAERPHAAYKKYIYQFSGFFCTLVLLTIASLNHFWENKQLYWAFVIQLIIETNPFYSDFVISIIDKKNSKYKKPMNHGVILKTYFFSPLWYLHFIIWTIFIILLFNLKFI